MSTSASLKVLLRASWANVSMASRIGMPARMNAASWREKFMRSARGTRFLVISNCQTLFFSLQPRPARPSGSSAAAIATGPAAGPR